MRSLIPNQRPAVLSALTLTLWLAGCGAPPLVVEPDSRPAASMPAPVSRVSEAQAQQITITALGLVGTPYRYGGNTPESGFDCSGLIGWVFRTEAGMAAPRTVAALQDWGQPVPAAALRSGDLVLFGQGGPPTHAGIYVGEGRFVHAPSTGGRVRLDRLSTPHWARQQIQYRRP